MQVAEADELVYACDNHYRTMVGRGVKEQLISLEADGTQQSLFCAGIAPYVSTILRRRESWADNLKTIPAALVLRVEGSKV